MELTEFWISVKGEYPLLNTKAQWILILFVPETQLLCGAGFLAVAMVKSKYHAKISVEQEMRVAVSSLIPMLEKLCSAQQAHTCH